MTFRTAIVLGSTRGIGRALVKRLAADLGPDAHVYLTARSSEEGKRAEAELAAAGTRVDHFVFDLSDAGAPARVAAALAAQHGGLDIMIQNGAYMPSPGAPVW